MKPFQLRGSVLLLALASFSMTLAQPAAAQDIDIFTGASGGSSAEPTIIFLLDDSPNWGKQDQKLTDLTGTVVNSGTAELGAIANLVSSLGNTHVKVGLAMLTDASPASALGSGGGAYIRFAPRDVTDATVRAAIQDIVNNIDVTKEKLKGQASKDESAGFYELYRYIHGQTPYYGTTALQPLADYNGNVTLDNGLALTGYAEMNKGSEGPPFAFTDATGATYLSPSSGCAQTFIIYIANNSQGSWNQGLTKYNPADTTTIAGSLNDTTKDYLSDWTSLLLNDTPNTNANAQTTTAITYVLDAYNANQNATYSTYLQNAANFGGGKYYQVSNETAILSALKSIMAEILSVNSVFSSTSLPISATNRTQDQNQVFIGMFRPDMYSKPRWLGNLKLFQLANSLTGTDLVDTNNQLAISSTTGFLAPCSQSIWTTDSQKYGSAGNLTGYWRYVLDSPVPKSTCTTPAQTTTSKYSDSPDGPFVEKGGVAEVIRKGNSPATTNATPTWTLNRNTYTANAAGKLVTFDTKPNGPAVLAGLSTPVINYIQGLDVGTPDLGSNGAGGYNIENQSSYQNSALTQPFGTSNTRPSLHGDVVHSPAMPIDYDSAGTTIAYYGSNDGMIRAVNATTGQELWSFIAPEFYADNTRFNRLYNNAPLDYYPGINYGTTATAPKDYFFDGTIGSYLNYGSGTQIGPSFSGTAAWIYPSMRRGGRKIYAFDVTNPSSPPSQVMWSHGCPDLTDDTNCDTGFTNIGQTWSAPLVAQIDGYSSPVVIFGGGYDTCEDTDSATPSCAASKGAMIFVLDAKTGALVGSVDLRASVYGSARSVAADISLLDANGDGIVDYAYAVDEGGNIYRLDFKAAAAANSTVYGSYTHRVAYTNGSYRKFQYAPALFYPGSGNSVYVADGTGDREHPLASNYPYTTPVTNRFYVFMDNLASTTNTQNLDDPGSMLNGTGTVSCGGTQVLPGGNKVGWFKDLTDHGVGEQMISAPLIAGGLVTFNTSQPVAAAAGSCASALGNAYGYWLNLFSASGAIGVSGTCGGSNSTKFVGGGLVPSAVSGIVNINGTPTQVIIGAPKRDGSSTSPISAQHFQTGLSGKRRRVYWRQQGTDSN